MSLFGALDISASGIDAAQTWINTTAGNIANSNDVTSTSQPAYGEQTPVFTATTNAEGSGDGVQVSSIQEGATTGIVEFDPTNPIADSQGNVRATNVDISTQLGQLVEAQNDFQANAAAMQRAVQAYQSALTLGH